jgi:hypothetical protein
MFKVTTYNSCAGCGYYGVGRTMPDAYRKMLKKASKQFITYRAYGGRASSDLDGYAQVEEQFIAARKLMARSKSTRTSVSDGWRVITVEIERMS